MQLTDCGCNNPCTNCAQVAPIPCTKDKCRKTLETTKIAQLVWLQGLDENLCERFQRLSDAVGLRDCAGHRVSLETPVVLCSDFKAQLCAAIAGLVDGGVAVPNSTQLVGADCKFYTIPAGGSPGTETPNTAVDTTTIDMSATGTLGRAISGSVKISSDAGNEIQIRADGLYAPSPASVPSTCTQIAAFGVGADVAPGMLLIGADCQKHVFPAPVPISVTDTSSVNLTLTGTNLEADLKLDPATIGRITGSGLQITCADVLACAPAVTVLDTLSVNLSLAGQQVSADVIVSPEAFNALELRASGLFVDVCSALSSGNPPVPAVVASTVLVGADCNRYTLPTPIPLSGGTTPTAATSVIGNTVSVNVLVDSGAGNLLSVGGSGLQVTCESVQDCAFGITNNFWTYNDIANSVAFNPSSDAGNQITTGGDGRPFVPAFSLAVLDTDCINLQLSSGVLSAFPIISAQPNNSLLCLADGLFSASADNVTITGMNSNCLQTVAAEGPTNTFQITVYPIISSDVGNVIECRPSGLYAPSSSLPVGDVCAADTPALFGLVLGSDALGNAEWQNPQHTDLSVGAVTLSEINDATNRDTVFWLSGNIVLPTPTDRCSRYDIYVKNVSGIAVTVTAAALIDGQSVITLEGTSTGAYPFGNDGGESAHLYYSFSLATWKVL